MKWFLKVLRQYADFEGRASREEYWMFVLFNIIFSFVILIIGTVISFVTDNPAAMLLSYMYIFALLIPGLAVTVRRLHDTGRSGWFLLVNFIPFIGGIWLLIVLILDGTHDENCYGLNPKDEGASCRFDRNKSVAVALIISSIIYLLVQLLDRLIFLVRVEIGFEESPFEIFMFFIENGFGILFNFMEGFSLIMLSNYLVHIGVMIAGLLLLKRREFTNEIAYVLIVTSAIWFFNIFSILYSQLFQTPPEYINYIYPVLNAFDLLLPAGLLMLCISILQKSNNKKNAAYIIIVGSCAWIVNYFVFLLIQEFAISNLIQSILWRITIIMPMSFLALGQMLLAGENAGFVKSSNVSDVKPQNRDPLLKKGDVVGNDISGKVIFIREDRENDSTWVEIGRASCRERV